MSTNVGSIDLELLLSSNKFNKQLKNTKNIADNASNSISKSLLKIGKAAIAAFSVKKIFDFGKECINLGSDLAEVQNVVDVSFATMNESVNAFAENAIEQFGLSQTVTKKYMGTFGAMSKAFGFAEKDAFEMSKALTGLAGDVASFYNMSSDEAYTKLKSVFTGETETLKELGVVMTQSALDQYALANGYGKTTSKMTEQEKVALRYKFVIDQLALASGDFTRTQDNWANQTRVLTLRFSEFKATIGQGLINLFTPVLKIINTLLAKLQVLANAFKSFSEFISGTKQESNGGIGSISNDLSSVTNNAVDASGAVGGIGSSAKKAAKDLKSLASFDTAQILKSDSGDSTSGASGEAGASISTGNLDFGSLDVATEKVSLFNNLNFDNLINAFNRLKEAVEPITQTIWSGLKWAYDEILKPLAKWTIEDLLPAFFNVLAGALKVLNPILISFGNIFRPIWDNLLKPLLSWTGGVIVDVLNGVADALTKVGNWMSNNQGIVDKIVISLAAFFGLWKLTQLMAFIQMSGGVVAAITKMTAAVWSNIAAKAVEKADTIALTLMYAKDFVVSMASATAAIVKQVAQWVASTAAKAANTAATIASTAATTAATAATWLFNTALAVLTSPITLVVVAIGALIAGIVLLVKNWDTVKEAGARCWDFIKNAWNSAGEWFNSTIIQPIGKFFSSMWQGLIDGATNAWNTVKTTTVNVFGGIWDTIKSIINVILGGIEKMVNGVIKGINMMTSALNKLSFDIPDWIPGIGGKKFGFNISQIGTISIPKLANGGFFKANQPTLAMVGDNKSQAEIVSPMNKMEEAFQNVLARNGLSSNKEIIELLKTIIQLLKDLGFDFNLFIDGQELNKRLEKIRKKKNFATNGG